MCGRSVVASCFEASNGSGRGPHRQARSKRISGPAYGQTKALKNINLPIYDRTVTAFIGPSGCGKSTLLRILNRMYDLYPNQHAEGEVLFDGENILGGGIDLNLLRSRVGMVFQKYNPFPKSIYENVVYGLRIAGVKNRTILAETVENSLRAAALWDEVKDRLHESALRLSGGQMQRLCIARTLALRPEVILFDEPTAALDPISTLRVEETLQSLRESYCIAIVTHNLQQAQRVADYTAFMYVDTSHGGRTGYLVEFGESRQIFEAPKHEHTQAYIRGEFS